MSERPDNRWLLLIHQILPKSESTLEDFQWVLREITQGGGDASLCEAGFVEGLTDAQIESLFRAARDADYATIAEEARELTKRKHSRGSDSVNELAGAVTSFAID